MFRTRTTLRRRLWQAGAGLSATALVAIAVGAGQAEATPAEDTSTTAAAAATEVTPDARGQKAVRDAIVKKTRAAWQNPRKFRTVAGGRIYESRPGAFRKDSNYLGRAGSNANRNQYNGYNGLEWCGYFLGAMWGDVPARPDAYPSSQAWRTEAGKRWHPFRHADKPKPGDVLVWTNHDASTGGHVGIVVGQPDANSFFVIEGNAGYGSESIVRNKYSWAGNGPIISGKTFRGFASRF